MTDPTTSRPRVEFIKDDPPPPPPPAHPMPPPVVRGSRPNVGAGIGVLGLALALISVFGLPVENYGRVQTATYGQYHDIAASFGGSGSDIFFQGYAQVWWHWLLLVAAGVLAVLVAVVAVRANAVLGWVLAVVAALVGALHAVALGQTSDYLAVQRLFKAGPSVYDQAGIGIWLSFVGFGILAIGGLVSALTSRTRPAVPPPPR